MSESADTAARTQRFNDAVRAFTPPSPSRHAKLMPLKDGIIELRQKGASLRVIRELLATIGVAVGTDTIARFLAEMNGDSPSPRSSKRSARRRSVVVSPTSHQGETSPPFPIVETDAPSARPRSRGPRIADPRNL